MLMRTLKLEEKLSTSALLCPSLDRFSFYSFANLYFRRGGTVEVVILLEGMHEGDVSGCGASLSSEKAESLTTFLAAPSS